MNRFRGLISALPPILVVAALAVFVVYSLYGYKPDEHKTCASNMVAQQTDIAINVVRQWFGKAGEEYTGCQEISS